MQQQRQQTRHKRWAPITANEVAIFKYANANQYVVHMGTCQVNFIFEEDAQRFARQVSKCPKEFPVHFMQPK